MKKLTKKYKKKNSSGITLIALVVTIIVLIILAGISINLLLGNNGIITKAKDATQQYEMSQLKEELELEIINIQTRKLEQGKEFVREDLQELANIGAIVESTGIPAEGEYKDYFFEIDENYIVTIIGKAKGEKPTIQGEIITKGIVEQGGIVEIKVTASVNKETIQELIATNGATLKTDTSGTEKIFEVSSNGIYYFKAKADSGRSATIAVEVNTIIEKPEIGIKNITDSSFTIVVNTNYQEGLVTEYRYYVDGIAKSTGTTNTEYTLENLSAETKYENIYVEAYFGDTKLTSEEKEVTTLKILVTSIALNKTTTTIQKGKTETLTATIMPENATDNSITWTSSDTSVATVSNGTITAVEEGTTTIIATANDGSGVSVSCNITITPPPPPSASVGATTHTAKTIQYDWVELKELAKVISNNYGTTEGKINNNTVEVNVSINGKPGTLGIGDTAIVDGKKVRILGFNHDTLTNSAAYGGENQTAGISFEYLDFIISDSPMNSPYTNVGGWGECKLRSTLNNTTINSLSIKDYIKQVEKAYCATCDSSTLSYSSDYLWLLSCAEIWNKGKYSGGKGNSIGTEGSQYKYYKNINANYETGNKFLVKPSNKTGTGQNGKAWWLRSPEKQWGPISFCYVRENGWSDDIRTDIIQGVAPGFCI